MPRARVAVGALAAFLAVVGVVTAGGSSSVTVLQTVPPADIAHPSGFSQGDIWTFQAKAGSEVDIRIDTRGDNTDLTSNLDAVVFLRAPDGSYVAAGDDEVTCSRTPVCGFQCPLIHDYLLPQSGTYAIVVRDFGSVGDRACHGGGYNLVLTSEDPSVAKTLQFRTDDGGIDERKNALAAQLLAQKGINP